MSVTSGTERERGFVGIVPSLKRNKIRIKILFLSKQTCLNSNKNIEEIEKTIVSYFEI